jgi:hypothetical protein
MPRLDISLTIKYVMLTLLFALGAYLIIAQNWHALFMLSQALGFSLVPTFLRRMYNVHTPHTIQAGIVLFMFSTLFLGEVAHFYETYWWWDSVFHGLSGLAMGLIAYISLILAYRKHNVRLAPIFTSVFAICVSVALSAVWEIIEFSIDSFFGTNMQPSAADTMWDLIAGLVGALLSGWSGYRYILHNVRYGLNSVIHDGVIKNKDLSGERNEQ